MSLEERIKYASMKARHQKILRPWHKKWWGRLILLLLFLLAVAIITIVFVVISEVVSIKRGNTPKYLEQQLDTYFVSLLRPSSAHIGPIEAPIKIIEFSDFLQIESREAYLNLKYLRENYPDSVRIIHRDLPQSNESILLALIARCAGEQGKYWLMHDLIYDNQDTLQELGIETLWAKIEQLPDFTNLNLNINQYRSCVSSRKHQAIIQQDINDSINLNLQAPFTPSWFINSEPVSGYLNLEELESIIKIRE